MKVSYVFSENIIQNKFASVNCNIYVRYINMNSITATVLHLNIGDSNSLKHVVLDLRYNNAVLIVITFSRFS